MSKISLVPSVARLFRSTRPMSCKNVYQNMTHHWACVLFFVMIWAVIMAMVFSESFLGIYAVILMFPASTAAVAFVFTIPRYVQGKMLTRICEPGSNTWNDIALAYTSRGSILPVIAAVLVYPFWMPILWYQDGKRLFKAAKLRIKGEKVSLGSDEYIFYKKQAKKYNQIKETKGVEAAETFLMFTSTLTDIPNAAEISQSAWYNSIRDEIVAYKERKYGPMSAYGV